MTLAVQRCMYAIKTKMSTQPTIRLILPVSYWVSWCYVFLNLCMFVFLLNNNPILHFIIVGGIITFKMWAWAFLSLGIFMAVSLLLNDWHLLRYSMMSGFCIKLFWGIAVIFTAFDIGFTRSIGSIGVWLTLAAIQGIVMIYLFPKEVAIHNGERDIN